MLHDRHCVAFRRPRPCCILQPPRGNKERCTRVFEARRLDETGEVTLLLQRWREGDLFLLANANYYEQTLSTLASRGDFFFVPFA